MTSRSVLLRGIGKHTFIVVGELLLLLSSFCCPTKEQQASGSEPLWVVTLSDTPMLRRWGPLSGLGFWGEVLALAFLWPLNFLYIASCARGLQPRLVWDLPIKGPLKRRLVRLSPIQSISTDCREHTTAPTLHLLRLYLPGFPRPCHATPCHAAQLLWHSTSLVELGDRRLPHLLVPFRAPHPPQPQFAAGDQRSRPNPPSCLEREIRLTISYN
jgi:hypothetical protein